MPAKAGIQERRARGLDARLRGHDVLLVLDLRNRHLAQDAGIAVVLIDPRSTSQICHRCGTRGHRHALKFVCPRCGYVGDADVNAALNIATAGALVTAPELAAIG